MNLLIIDDNRYIVDSIKKSINWQSVGIGEVFGCYSGAGAREILQQHKISIMITDIEMPGISGIELAAWTRENGMDIDVVFLTSHADFTYAQQAISLQCLEYLLKPVEPEKIEQLVRNLVNRRRRILQEQEVFGQESAQEDKEPERTIFWRDLIENMISAEEEELTKYFHKHRLDYTVENLFTPVLFCYRFSENPQYTETVLRFIADNIINELCRNNGLQMEAHIRNGNYSFLVIIYGSGGREGDSAAQGFPSLMRTIRKFQEAHRRYFAGWVNCYVGRECKVSDIPEEAAALEEISLDDTERRNEIIVSADYKLQEKEYLTPEIAAWQSLLLAGEERTLLKSFTDYFARLKRNQSISSQLLEAFLADFLQAELYALRQKGISAYHFLSHCRDKRLYENASKSLADMERYLKDEVKKVSDQLAYANLTTGLAAEVKAFIEENLPFVTRSMVAERFSLSPNYLSKIFARTTGESLRDYIYRERMFRAMALLKNTEENISCIAENCGYPSFAHFTKMFKKHTGKTPMEYRKG